MPDPADDQPSAAVDAPDDHSALLAELRAERGTPAPAEPAAKRAPAAAPADDDGDPDGEHDVDADVDPDDAGQLDDDTDPDDADDSADPDDAADQDPDDDQPDPDPETAKRQAAVRKAEQRGRQALERDRATFERERATLAAELTELRAFRARVEAAAAKAKYNPTALLRDVGGLTDDDLEPAAQHVYAHSKAAASTPAHRAAAAKAAAERELADRVAAVERENRELRESQVTTAAQQAAVARVDDMIARTHRLARTGLAVDGAAPEAPLVAARLAKNPQATKDALIDVAARLSARLTKAGKLAPGQLPKPAMVVRAYERELQQLRAELGGDPPAPAAGVARAAGGAKVAQQIPPGKGKAKPPAAAAVVDEPDSGERPTNDQLIRELRGGAS